MHSSFHRLALAVLLAGSASFAPLLNVGAAAPGSAGTTPPVAAVRRVGAVVALTAPVPAPATTSKNTPPAAPTVTHGMLAALLAGTGNYGQPLIRGCVWATW